MLVFGIDPGSNATGYAAVSRVSGRYALYDAGVIRTKADWPMAERLLVIHRGLRDVIRQCKPEAVAIEAIFRHRSSESALRLGHARGVALLAAAEAELPIFEYNPMTVKKTIGGHGRADKDQLARLVNRLLGVTDPLAADAADAAAIAMTHLTTHALTSRLVGLR